MNIPSNIHSNQLEAKVSARNRVNAALPIIHTALVKALEPFVGKKVETVHGGLTAKVANVLAPVIVKLEADLGAFICHSSTSHSLRFYVKVCEVFPSRYPDTQIASYAEASLDVAEVPSMVLTELYLQPPTPRTDYTVDEIIRARADVAAARTALSLAQSKLQGFGEFEN